MQHRAGSISRRNDACICDAKIADRRQGIADAGLRLDIDAQHLAEQPGRILRVLPRISTTAGTENEMMESVRIKTQLAVIVTVS